MKRHALTLFALVALATPDARADFLIRIGDIDGFGYGAAPGFLAANGGPANLNGGPILNAGDFLPDINRNGTLQNGSDDEFDFRNAAERANTAVQVGAGATNTGTTGSSFTDISLARTYDARSAAGQVLIGGNPISGLIRGPGGPFPSPPSDVLPNQPGFVFNFDVDRAVLDPQPIFFNLIFGDYDVVPAEIRITTAAGTTRVIGLVTQGSGRDGLIQAATATINFNEVFADGGAVWRGLLRVDFVAPNEPYTAFDYVELSTTALVPTVPAVPEPSAVVLAAVGALAAGVGARRRRRREGA